MQSRNFTTLVHAVVSLRGMYLDGGMGGGGWLLTSFFSIIYILGLVCYKHTIHVLFGTQMLDVHHHYVHAVVNSVVCTNYTIIRSIHTYFSKLLKLSFNIDYMYFWLIYIFFLSC